MDVNAEMVMAYCYALLGGRGYVRRFEDELCTPGARVPITSDAELFQTVVGVGRELLRVHTYQEVRIGCAREITPVGARCPDHYVYEPAGELLVVGDGRFGPVTEQVWSYSVSGYRVVAGWLRQRIARTGKSPLDAIRLEAWTPTLSSELLQLIWLIETTLALEPRLDQLLDAVVSSTDRAGRR
jgi:hypothetical protein